MPAPVLDFWFDFASTYSYPAAMRIGALAEDAGVRVRFRPFLLGPIFQAQGWTTSPFNLYAAKGRNMWRDLERLCADLGLPFRRPDPFPQNSLLAARVALAGLGRTDAREFSRADSLGEDLLSENGASADSCGESWGEESWGEDFCRAVFRAEFGDGRRIDDPATIADILAGLQIDARRVLAAAQSDAVKARLRTQTGEAQQLGLFGAPSFTTADGELFWGNDRLEAALRWAQGGPKMRSPRTA